MQQQVKRTLALCALFQAANCVKELAWHSKTNEEALYTCINSLIATPSNDPEFIYGDPQNLHIGCHALKELFGKNSKKKDPEIARYVFSLLHLERKLVKNPQMLQLIKEGLAKVNHQLEHFPLMHDNILANLASIYTDTLSTFNFKIYIRGKQFYLNNTCILNKIRSSLLAGIRAARLWNQLGGSKWQLLFMRSQLIKSCDEILELETIAD